MLKKHVTYLEFNVESSRRQFDKVEALHAAMNVFWKKGYASASLSDLTSSMGINKPSMYATFGNKEALFIEATDLYIKSIIDPTGGILFMDDLSLKERLTKYMMTALDIQCDSSHMKGCYLAFCRSEAASGEIPEQAEAMLKEYDVIPPPAYIDFFTKDPESVALGLDQKAYKNAMLVYTMLKGTASMARAGVEKENLEHCISTVIDSIGFK